MSKGEETGIWNVIYIEGKGMLCGLCRMTNTLQPSNNSKVWNSKGSSTRFRTEVVRDHFSKTRDIKTKHGGAISIERIRRGTYFVEYEKTEEMFVHWKSDVRFILALRGKSAPLQINLLLELAESFGVEKVATFKKRSNSVLKELLLILSSEVKEKLLKRIKKFPFFGILRTRLLILQTNT